MLLDDNEIRGQLRHPLRRNANLMPEASTVAEYVAMLRFGKSAAFSQQTIVVASR
jgi:hypothetical protein